MTPERTAENWLIVDSERGTMTPTCAMTIGIVGAIGSIRSAERESGLKSKPPTESGTRGTGGKHHASGRLTGSLNSWANRNKGWVPPYHDNT